MADMSYTVDVNTTNAQRNLDALNKKVDALNTTFGKLRSASAGIAFGSMIVNANLYADAIQDLSDTTGIATQSIVGFSTAVMQNGGDADKAQQGILKLVQTIGDAADGSKEAQLAFEKVGITLTDLRTLSEEDLLKKSIQGIGKLSSVTERINAQVALFGKNARGVNFQGVAGGMGAASSDAAKYAAAIKSGADAQQSLEVNMKNLTQALLNVIKPLNDIVSSINISTTAFESLIKAIGYAVAAYLVFAKGLGYIRSGATAVISSVSAVGGVFAWLGGVFAKIGAEIMGFLRMWGRIITGASSAASVFGALVGTVALLGRAFLRLLGVVGIILSIGEAVNFLSKQFFNFDIVDWATNKLKNFYEWGKKITGLGDITSGAGAGRGGSDQITKQLQERGEELRKQGEEARKVEDAFAKQRKQIEQVSVAFRTQNNEVIDGINLEKSLIGKSQEYAEIVRAQEDIYKRAAAEADKLRVAKSQLSDSEQKLIPVYDAQIAKINEQAQADAARVGRAISGLQDIRLLEQDRINNLERITQAMERQKDIAGVTSEVYSDLQKQLGDLKFGQEQRGRTPAEQKIAEISRQVTQLEAEMAGKIMAAFETEDGYTNIQQMNAELEKMYKMTGDLKQAQLDELSVSRQWSTGWTEAFNQYIDSATNAATAAQQTFQSVTSNMNSAIDKFVDEGKFSFKDFTASVLRDILKIQLKMAAAKLIQSTGFASLLGFADGGSPPVNKPSIVGENGPELFVPRTAGTVVPNEQLGGGGSTQNTYITNNISAVDAKSVAQLFAENRQILLGTVRQAEKELPYRTR
jgi:lambda family phage tail tape measure protein